MYSWEYLEEFKVNTMQNKSIKTVEAYLYDLKLFSKYLKNDILDIKQIDIENYKNYLLTNGRLKAKTVNRKLISIKRFIDFLNKNKNTKIEIEFKFLKIQRQTFLNEILELSDFNRLVNQAESINDKRAIAIFYTLYYTGLRVSELLTLTTKIVDKQVIEVTGKGDKIRQVLLNSKINEHIKNYINERGHENNSYIFINRTNNNPMNRQSVHRLIKKYAGKSKVKLDKAHAHSFRHLNALRLLEEGATLEEVADLLGHNDLNTTRIYTKKTKEGLFKTVNKL